MSASERAPSARENADRVSLKFGTIVIVGGGCYGSYYVRQLRRASAAGAVAWEHVVVIDRDQHCSLATSGEVPVDRASKDNIRVVVREWREFFREYLARAASDRAASQHDAIVPSPLMPHLMFDWIVERARERWPDRTVAAAPLERAPDTPWQRSTPDGPHFVSFAEWICPINCIEPRICPHTRSERTWSLPRTAEAYVRGEQQSGRPLAGPVIFHCAHRAYGVGMFDTREVLDGDSFVRSAGEQGSSEILVGTVSHCHGAFQRLLIGAPRTRRSAE